MTMSELLKNIDARTKLAGTNKLEILLFFLGVDQRTGRRETYGINVFKVREVMRTPVITAAPDMPPRSKGMVSLRGALVPVIDLAKYSGISRRDAAGNHDRHRVQRSHPGFSGRGRGYHPAPRLEQDAVPPEMLTAQTGGLVTAVTELEDGRLVMMMDVEKVLSKPHRSTTKSCSVVWSRSTARMPRLLLR
jgi:two-component system, chemotaxis family, chemotaxis protein CheV